MEISSKDKEACSNAHCGVCEDELEGDWAKEQNFKVLRSKSSESELMEKNLGERRERERERERERAQLSTKMESTE